MNKDALTKRGLGVLRFNSGDDAWTIADPEHETLGEALHRLRYNRESLRGVDVYRLLDAAEAYLHLTTHPMGTERAIVKLRAIRKALRTTNPGG